MNVLRYMPVMPVMLVAVLLPAASGPLRAESAARYEAVFVDGMRLYGENVSGWGELPGSPRLGDAALMDAKRPLRWLRDRSLKPWSPSEGDCYIEFVGGDRLVGHIEGVGAGDGLYEPAHLVVKPAAAPHQPVSESPPRVRILPGRIQRVVFRPGGKRRLQPGTLYYRDGRKVGFVHLRWREESVVLLLKDGACKVQMSEIADIHLPHIDPWQAYYQELAVLSPACRSRMMRIETTSGLIATGSDLRFGALAYGSDAQQQAVTARLKQSERQFATVAGKRKAQQLKLDLARAKYHEELAESEKQIKAARQAHQKALVDMRQRLDELRKANAAELAKRRGLLDKELLAADQAMRKRLTREPPEKRDKMLKAFGARQAQLRKSREKLLKNERMKFDRRERQMQTELQRLVSAGPQKLQRQTKELQKRVGGAKREFEAETTRWEAFLRILESSRLRYDALREGTSESWCHIVQPVWSLDALSAPFGSIRMRWSFAPEQVPLCRIRPASRLSPPFLPAHTNRGFAGGPLRSGGQSYAWGFAVHAYSELRFPLPKCASAFRSRIGLDSIVGQGGCARARVYVGSTTSKPAYESPLLTGSKKTVDSGSVRLATRADGPKLLILQADPVDRGAPDGADPLNIRDKLDWLDPRLELDKARLQEQVRRQIGPLIASSPGWTLRLDRRGVYTWTNHFDKQSQAGERRFWTMLRAGGQALSLSREMTIGPEDKWLAVHVGLPTGENPEPDTVTLRVGEQRVGARKVPIRQSWQDLPTPLVFPLARYQGKKITLELTQAPGGKPLHWQSVSISKIPPPQYRLVDIMEFVGKKDMKVPYELGLALQSSRIPKTEKLAALEINQLGGTVNFRPSLSVKVPLDTLDNVMVGRDWIGGDKAFIKTFTTFKKMPSLKSLLVTEESGVSVDAIAKLRAEMPKLTISRIIIRIPSADRGAHRPVTWRNHCKKDVIILWINQHGKLGFSVTRRIKPGEELKRSAFVGVRYEAHYPREDFANAQDYFFSQPLSSFVVTPGGVWEIKPGRQGDRD